MLSSPPAGEFGIEMVPSANSYFAPRRPNRKTFIPTSDGTWSHFLDADRLFSLRKPNIEFPDMRS